MNYQVVTKTVSAQPLAAVRRSVRIGTLAEHGNRRLTLSGSFLGRHEGLRTDGHNCFLYHHPAPAESAMVVDFGVQVIRSFRDEGEVVFKETPAGEVAMTTPHR
jgi:hypothetical protein